MAQRGSKIQFPGLVSFTIRDYALYPGVDGDGFTSNLLDGVNIVVGINGLGKTTLLNALFRVMSGPADWSKRSLSGPAGSTSVEIDEWKTKDFFKRRVPDGAVNSIISATLAFGQEQITISRKLSDLSIQSIEVDGSECEPDEETFRRRVCEMANLPGFEDFYLVLRYLVFFLEDRQPVIWDGTAQADILRVLFYDPDHSVEVRNLFGEIQRMDSNIRNFVYALGKQEKRLRRLEAEFAGQAGTAAEIGALATAIEAGNEALKDLSERLEEKRNKYTDRRTELEERRIEREELLREYEETEMRLFSKIFPSLDDTASYVILHATSGGGCLVCGDRAEDVKRRVRERLSSGHCPICDSAPTQQEKVLYSNGSAEPNLQELDEKIAEIQTRIITLEDEVAQISQRRAELSRQFFQKSREVSEAEKRYEYFQGRLPRTTEQLKNLQQWVVSTRRELTLMRAEREGLEERFLDVITKGESRVQEVAGAVTKHFEEYAQFFLADECSLVYKNDSRRIGQAGRRFDFPIFSVSLSSGVFRYTKQPRDQSFEVSESQREFIDLAFRMALMSVASGESPAMMVLETPEASLDAVFIARAGALLGSFAAGGHGNRLIATCNLNQTDMIPTLLGVLTPEERRAAEGVSGPAIPSEQREQRLINLLDLAVKNAALRKYSDIYANQLKQALYPEWEAPADGE